MSIQDFPDYAVSSLGSIRREVRGGGGPSEAGRLLKFDTDKAGYLNCRLRRQNKHVRKRVHRLVAAAFLGPANGREVNHLDANKANPALSNLEYTDRQGNVMHASAMGLLRRGESHPMAKLTDASVVEIMSLRGGEGSTDVARKFGVCSSLVRAIWRRRLWRHVEIPEALV